MSDRLDTERPNPWKELTQPFVDLAHAPRALWGINLPYFLEGLVYFGILGYLAMYFNKHVGLDDHLSDIMVGVLTWGITFSMFLFGGLADRFGVRRALLWAFSLMLVGRVVLASGTFLGLPGGLGSPLHLVTMGGILFVILGYGMYMPASYAAVRQFTTPETAGMGYAMLYALMNLGGWLPTFAFLIRDDEYLGWGIPGAYAVYAGITVLSLVATFLILTPRVVREAIERAQAGAGRDVSASDERQAGQTREPFSVVQWLRNHPLADARFSFFIFCLIPVQTLFAHNWLTLPMYVERAYRGTWIGDKFEVAVNFNPLLIFILVPIVTALTQRRRIYDMMILGTTVMAAPTFLLALGPSAGTLFAFLVLMTVGEALWQPRFLQYAAEIAPKGRTGAYMGVAQFPWFLTKVITSLYAGWFLERFCPNEGPQDTQTMWFIYGLIAISSPLMLVLARGWLGRNFKERADG